MLPGPAWMRALWLCFHLLQAVIFKDVIRPCKCLWSNGIPGDLLQHCLDWQGKCSILHLHMVPGKGFWGGTQEKDKVLLPPRPQHWVWTQAVLTEGSFYWPNRSCRPGLTLAEKIWIGASNEGGSLDTHLKGRGPETSDLLSSPQMLTTFSTSRYELDLVCQFLK